MSRPVSRVLTLLELLQTGGVRTVADLAGRLGVAERTVRRYVDHLVDLDIPVESVRGRHGGYRLAPGHRMPPLMLTDDEALAVLLGLVAGRRTGLTAAAGTAGETASAKVRRVLPERLRRRLDAVLQSVAFTAPPTGSAAVPETGVLLTVADAVRGHRPVSFRYGGGRRGEDGAGGAGAGGAGAADAGAADAAGGERTMYPYGLVAHAGRWYVTGRDLSAGADRTFRLDRVAGARILPGTFEPPDGPDPAERVLTSLATAPYRHAVTVWVRGTAEEVRTRLPGSVAVVAAEEESWSRVEIRAERLDWLPGVLASLDLPFAVERPDELRELVAEFANRLADSARRTTRDG
ncbi:helix-turn-helix transcriptional regulator [Streptomyces parvulus]|uniref:helix-turn-helix transcriptional regulator n=1 Tax=Streptomyces parvulus TaxID=146923 RepID=UPI00368CDCA0